MKRSIVGRIALRVAVRFLGKSLRDVEITVPVFAVHRNGRGSRLLPAGGRPGPRSLHRGLLHLGDRNRGRRGQRLGDVRLFLVSGELVWKNHKNKMRSPVIRLDIRHFSELRILHCDLKFPPKASP